MGIASASQFHVYFTLGSTTLVGAFSAITNPSFEALALGGEVFKLGIFEDFTINGAWCDIDNVDAATNADRMGQFICESII